MSRLPAGIAELTSRVHPTDPTARATATARQEVLAKPPGSLGQLEGIGAQLSAIARRCPPPVPERPTLIIAAGDHGVHAQGVTKWPQSITSMMVDTAVQGTAAASVLARVVHARVEVLDVGVIGQTPAPAGVHRHRVVPAGTRDLSQEPAMTIAQATQAVGAGAKMAMDAIGDGTDLLLTGDLGIANTTPSACLIAALTGSQPQQVVGPGAANDPATVVRKVAVVRAALQRHGTDREPMQVLASLGGSEHAALVGLILAAAANRIPVVLDGVIAGAAALTATALCPPAAEYLIAGHRSTEPGASIALDSLGLLPLLDLSLRLGEGTGALLAVPLVQSSAAVLSQMATLEDLQRTARTD
ncbi:hypothetical protein BH24ACT15_BH24ACT15_11760 [soil metagenome]|jgi:nicotinate-nucleotide--dimethylbenzimidazole phosphoribosyltransferase